jgi:hypothetical protein
MYSTDEAGLAVSPKKLSGRYHLCHELLATESNYVEVLKIIMVCFLLSVSLCIFAILGLHACTRKTKRTRRKTKWYRRKTKRNIVGKTVVKQGRNGVDIWQSRTDIQGAHENTRSHHGDGITLGGRSTRC